MIQADIVGSNKIGIFLGVSLVVHVAVLGTLPELSSSRGLPAPRSITMVLQSTADTPSAKPASLPAKAQSSARTPVDSPAVLEDLPPIRKLTGSPRLITTRTSNSPDIVKPQAPAKPPHGAAKAAHRRTTNAQPKPTPIQSLTSTAAIVPVMKPAQQVAKTIRPAPSSSAPAVLKIAVKEPLQKAGRQLPARDMKQAKLRVLNRLISPPPTARRLASARTNRTTPVQSPSGAENPTPSSFAATTVFSQTAGERAAIDFSRLSALLHQEILQYQRYPTLAKRQRREGIATVSFQLFPNGELQAVSLGNSSGYKALDNAALRAVKSVSPFPQAGEYLTRAQEFSVNVIFNLR